MNNCIVCSKESCIDYHSIEELKAARNRRPTAEEFREALKALVAYAKQLENSN